MLSALKNIFILLGLLLTAGLGYYLYTTNNAANLQGGGQIMSIEAESAELIKKIDSIRRITLESDIFSDPRFTNLRNFGSPVPVYPVGRTNPFEATQ